VGRKREEELACKRRGRDRNFEGKRCGRQSRYGRRQQRTTESVRVL